MYISPKSTRTSSSRRSTKQRAQFESEVTSPTSRTTAYRSIFSNFSRLTRSLKKRKGGGGKGRGSPSGSKGSKGSKGSDTKSSGKPSKVKLDGDSENLPKNKKSATSYGAGGGEAARISPGLPFAGRIAGGGNRQGVYGNSMYGSGYPGVLVPHHGVSGLGFPYYFWPVVWYGNGQNADLFDSAEYGLPDNTSRPGGALEFATFHSKNTSSTFMVVADKSTVSSLLGTLKDNCSSYLSSDNTSSSPTPYTNQSTTPGPEQAIQYYRASSVVLVLNGYDSGVLNGTQNLNTSAAPVISLPNGTDTTLLTCLNDTIGRAVPLIDAGIRTGPPAVYTLLIVWLLTGAFRSMFWV